ncbi:Penicillin-binding protein 2B [compost metagenome]
MGVPSSKQPAKQVSVESVKVKTPDLIGMSLEGAKDAAKQAGAQIESLGKGAAVLEQFPKAGTEIGASQRIYIVMQQMEAVPLPDLSGKSLRDAMEVCSFLKVKCQVKGQGYVVEQTLSGEGNDRVIQLQLHPLSENVEPSPTPSPKATSDPKKSNAASTKPNPTVNPKKAP